MDDLDELKGRVERATRALSEREAEEQGRHSRLMSLVAALEAKTLEAREEKARAETRLAEAATENAELRGLLGGLLDAVEAGSRSRFADAIYALEERLTGGTEAEAAADPLDASTERAAEVEPLDDDFTERLAANCGVEDELAREAEDLRAEAADDAMELLARIRRQVEARDEAEAVGRPEAAVAPEAGVEAEADVDPQIGPEAAADAPAGEAEEAEGEDRSEAEAADETSWPARRHAAS